MSLWKHAPSHGIRNNALKIQGFLASTFPMDSLLQLAAAPTHVISVPHLVKPVAARTRAAARHTRTKAVVAPCKPGKVRKPRTSKKVTEQAAEEVFYPLHYLTDKKWTRKGVMYEVLWQAIHGCCPKTWEYKSSLLKDDPTLREEMGLVDAWVKAGRKQSFASFLGQTEQGEVLLTANDDESCGFVAIRTAAELLGRPDIYSEAMYEAFVRASVDHATDAAEGLTPSSLCAFVRQLWLAGAPIDKERFDKNWHKSGHFHADAIFQLNLPDGVYVVGASKLVRVSHAFALKVENGEYIVHDDRLVLPLEEYGSWITRVRFVRELAVLEQ